MSIEQKLKNEKTQKHNLSLNRFQRWKNRRKTSISISAYTKTNTSNFKFIISFYIAIKNSETAK